MTVQNNVVENQSANVVQNQNSNTVQNQGIASNTVQNQGGAGGAGGDLVQLSNASSLVALAKGMIPADKQATFDAVSAQFRGGGYQPDTAGMSQAIVQGHIG